MYKKRPLLEERRKLIRERKGKGPDVGTCRGNPRDGCDSRPMKIVVLAQAAEEMGHVE